MSGRKVLHMVVILVSVMILAHGVVVNTSAANPQQREIAGLQDTLRPTIEVWNISRSAYEGEPFTAWADVRDLVSGVRNVSLIIRDSAMNHPALAGKSDTVCESTWRHPKSIASHPPCADAASLPPVASSDPRPGDRRPCRRRVGIRWPGRRTSQSWFFSESVAAVPWV